MLILMSNSSVKNTEELPSIDVHLSTICPKEAQKIMHSGGVHASIQGYFGPHGKATEVIVVSSFRFKVVKTIVNGKGVA